MTRGRKCPVCASTATREFLRRDGVPVHQNQVCDDQLAAQRVARGDLRLCCCDGCGFIFNAAFDREVMRYDARYDNTQTCSPCFSDHVERLARMLVYEQGVRESRIVEVGCGKGHFIRRLVELEGSENCGFGFDPTYEGPEDDLGGRLRFERSFYDERCADLAADVIVCRHVIEHVPSPVELLTTVRRALRSATRPRLFFETPCVEWILENQVVWDFFYEHCSYFSASSLRTAFEVAGFQVEEVRHVFGGQYLWLEATLADRAPAATTAAGRLPALSQAFGERERELTASWLQSARDWTHRGSLALWGAGAKGTTFANLVDPDKRWLAGVVDLNPNKQGRYVPGTGHRIMSPNELQRLGVAGVFPLNPNYRSEIEALIRREDMDVLLVDFNLERQAAGS